MKSTSSNVLLILVLVSALNLSAQVGIGTTSPHVSSILDISSDSKGVLVPRMESSNRLAIATPAEGLLVFDTDDNTFYYFEGSAWVKLDGAVARNNYKLIQTLSDLADELAAGGGTSYLLNENFLYEINGTINLTAPINLNGAYIIGEDTNEDILVRAGGTLFEGGFGGSVRGLTLTAPGGTIFNLTGSAAKTETLVFRDCVVANSNSVGTITSFNLVFSSIIEFLNNTDGLTYSDINQVLLNSGGWEESNGGVYETFAGSFDMITKQGGFSKVTSATAALDITGITNISGGASLRNVSFYGGGNYINGASPYVGYDFSNDWEVNSPGILVETDGVASGNFYFNGNLVEGFNQSISNNIAVEIQGDGAFVSSSLFRFRSAGGDNRLIYDGVIPRAFKISASMSVRVTGASGNFYAFVIAKNGTLVTESNSIVYIDSDTQIQSISMNSNINLANGDYIEVFTQRLTGSGTDNLVVFSENVSIK